MTRHLSAFSRGTFGIPALAMAGALVATPAAASSVTTLYSFSGGNDGASPYGIRVNGNTLYGVTFSGGANGQGVLYSIPKTGGTPTILHTFAGSGDGAGPTGAPIFDQSGNMLGTAVFASVNSNGVGSGYGTIYEVSQTSGFKTVHSFTNTDGANPYAGLTNEANGSNLYGTTSGGGSSGDGIVYKLVSQGSNYTFSTLYTFTGGTQDGANPYGGVTWSNNVLYGATVFGGQQSFGTIYSVSTATGAEQIVYPLQNNGADGAYPRSGIAVGKAGQLYGTASFYGSPGSYTGRGSLFELTQTYQWLYTVMHSFTGNGGDGASPWASLTADAAGNFYGTTTSGGQYGHGSVFKITFGSDGSYAYNSIYSFTGGSDGSNPYVALTFDQPTGYLYGTTVGGGANGKGTIFMVTP